MRFLRDLAHEDVCQVFASENGFKDRRYVGRSDGPPYDEWPRDRMKEANVQFSGLWSECELSGTELLSVRLHWNTELGIPQGSRPTVESVLQLPLAQEWLRQKKDSAFHDLNSHLILANGLFMNAQGEYRGTEVSGDYFALLDGLHRIVSWANLGRASALAFVAGKPPSGLPVNAVSNPTV